MPDTTYGASRVSSRNARRRGSSMVECALLLPWYVFLFVGAYDYGFICYGLIATQNAARVAAIYCSGSSTLAASCDSATVCTYALGQLAGLPNVGSAMTTCSSPVAVSSSSQNGLDGNPEAIVTVQYTTPQLIPIPGALPGTVTLSRTVKMRCLT
jgi:Flp pilus assembly protein TadG